MKRIERNSKILKEAEQDQPLKKTTIDLSRLAPMKIKDKNKKQEPGSNKIYSSIFVIDSDAHISPVN